MANLSKEDVFGGDTFLERLCEELEAMYQKMQVLTWNSGDSENIAIYQFSDDTIIEIGDDKTVIKDASGNEVLIISTDCPLGNVLGKTF